MLKKTITYVDYDGAKRTDDFYFNLSKPELIEMNFGPEGGMQSYIEKIIRAKDRGRLLKIFKEIILKAYGQKSLDGTRFEKSEEMALRFSQSRAYEELYMELVTDDEKAANFINSIIPSDLAENISKQNADATSAT